MARYSASAQLAYDTLQKKETVGIPTGLLHFMEHSVIERLACASPGEYKIDSYGVYNRMLENVGVNMVDQMLADNPLSMGDKGYENGGGGATTGGVPVVDGFRIDSPEACAEHMECCYIPELEQKIRSFNEKETIQNVILSESRDQQIIGKNILKTGYAHLLFPALDYYQYGYTDYFMTYALYPEIIDRIFKLQADYAVLKNTAVVKAFQHAGLPLYHRLDHDMADSRGLLVSMKSLKRSWVDHFTRSIRPAVDSGFVLLWHCDGNLNELIPYLLEAGVNGFQGFQYEDGMDYVKICQMKTRSGEDLIIQGGVSVTRTLPFGTPEAVKREMRFLVENGPKTGLLLSASSSVAPGVPWENIETMVEGFRYYRENGRR
ncbi:MAG: uroporphyrinogen decarboxylase family protein [Saccharofermentanales bacterium]